MSDTDASRPNRRGFLTGAVAATGLTVSPPAAADTVKGAAVNPRLFTFVGGKAGAWSVSSVKAVVGEGLPTPARVDIVAGAVAALPVGGA